MAGISSRIGTWALGVQGSKGTPAATPDYRFFLNAAPSLAPVKDVARYTLTDGGRDLQGSYTRAFRVEGDVPVYLHPQALAILFYGVLGTNSDGGSDPNYSHEITPANDLPWFTMWRMVGNQILEKFTDCKINSLTLTGTAGSPLSASMNIMGISSTFLASDPVLAAETDAPYLYMEGAGAIKFDTVAQKVTNLSLSINNNLGGYQADDYFFSDIDPGGREITLSFATRFAGATAYPDYRAFFYGSDAGTDLSPAIGTDAAEMTWTRDANTSLKIELPQISYAAMPVNPDPGGAPLEVQVTCAVEKPASDPIVTVTVEDQNASL